MLSGVVQATDVLLKYVVDSRPDKRKEKIREAYENGLISETMKDDLVSALGLRDFLAHTYPDEIDHPQIYDALQNDRGKYRDFANLLQEYVEQ
jgi:uncharacterized protein YutE (UPF0331/DUF86 family)